MGMSSSQARLLNLTSRMHQIEYKAAKIEAEKLQMANESRRAYLEYQNAMEQTKIQQQTLGPDASIQWKDVSYYDLMYGSSELQNESFGGAYDDIRSSANTIGLFSTETGEMYVTQQIKTAYDEANGSAEKFAQTLSGYIPTIPKLEDTDIDPDEGNEYDENHNNVNPSGGNDNVNPSGGNDNVNPSGGNDNVNPSGGNDNVNPSGGNDNVNPSGGNDNVNPSGGNDNVNPSGGNDNVNPSGGNDNVNPSGGNDNVNPSGGNDNVNPSGGNDNVNPSGGNDNVNPSGGNDNVNPSGGNDNVNPSGGNDNVNPSGGNDNVNPSGGNDSIDTDPQIEPNYEITRKGNTTITIPANKKNQILKINDDLLGTRYYTISTGSTAVTFEVLDNGRVLLKGNNTTIDAYDGQTDDFIIQGKKNTINTGDMNDTIRIGIAVDSRGTIAPVASSNNNVNAGSGDDYIQSYGYDNIIEGGDGYDILYSQGSKTKNNIEFTNYSSNTNNVYTWGRQNGYGSCQTLALINSINNQGKFNEFFNIQKDGDKWHVSFLKSGESVDVNESDITDDSAKGDKDLVVLETALRLLYERDNYGFSTNKKTHPKPVSSSYNFGEVSKIIYGFKKGAAYSLTKNDFRELWNAYSNGEISNLVVGVRSSSYTTSNPTLGIFNSHAYSVKNAEIGKFVTVVNPHDSRDSITFDWEDFFKYFKAIHAFGDTYNYINGVNQSSGSASAILLPEDISNGNDNTLYNYYYQLYQVIDEAGGCITIPDNMLHSKKYLSNMLNGGFAFLKEFNTKTQEWEDTSVATNTKLQEVQDETDLRKAEAKYEADMRRIDYKDRKFDYDLAALDNERNAIKQEIETLKTVARDNVERTFRLFS